MAKQRKRKTQRRKTPAPKTRRGAPSASRPLTLEAAWRLVRSRQPVKAAAAAKQPTPVRVGIERERLARERERETRRLTRDYKATLAILKSRGVKGLAAGGMPVMATAAAGTGPLQILAEGDSWFDYPVPLFGGGVIPRLERALGLPILNLAKAGDEVRYMLGVDERRELIEQLTRGSPAGGPWDVLLFSGGGNDIVDDPMALWVRDYDPERPPREQLHGARWEAVLELVRAGYEDLIGLRDRLSPGTHLVFHGYDFAIPDGRGVCHLGPWLKPTFDLRGFPSREAAFGVVQVMLREFAALLQGLKSAHGGVSVIATQGTLPERRSSWHNELHPARKGFDAFARLFRDELKALFPARLP